MSMTKIGFFGETIETEDSELIALEYCLSVNHASKRELIKKFDFKDRQVSKILTAFKFFQGIERSAKIAPAAISIGDNPIADKIIYSMNDTNTPPKGIVISASKGGNYAVLLLKNDSSVHPEGRGTSDRIYSLPSLPAVFFLSSRIFAASASIRS